MKKLIIAALLCIGFTSFAQEKKKNPNQGQFQTSSPQQKNENRVKRMVEELNLDSSQEQQLVSLFKNYPTNGTNKLTPEERKEYNKKLKEILTPDQMALLKSKRKQ
ncbi:MAG TPA: hypothetical protein PLO52_03560 [Flavobacterium alvei]|nr:hypothetical protein [Flavobacterium alvei]HQF48852.1 hypothetical protein [Flavobacterium alvei]HQK39176.1 hypothetical protein [Flavobacterium alvei]